ncbi:MAG: peptide ABC transporter substrate-binding protein [Spirochaetales bacterium]|nr:peptide ABC transporter substrate-binding protein [Spirochaetales bacterium]
MKKIFFLLMVLFGGFFPVFRISSQNPPAQDTADAEIVVTFFPSGVNFNPVKSYASTEAQIFTALYEGLVGYNPSTLDPVPAVARSWDVSSDGKTYTFRLREDARYANGDPVTAADFKASWLKFLDPQIKAEYSFLYDIIAGARDYRSAVNPDPESVGIKVLSPLRLQVVLEEPATHFLKVLCHHSFLPIHPDMLSHDDWNSLPEIIGNGPYRIIERSEALILLEKNPHYWDAGNVKTEKLRLVFSEDDEKTIRDFNDYKTHWVVSTASLDKVLYQDTIIINPLFATSYFYFANTGSPWNNGKIRRALALLVPWEDVRSTAFQFLPAKTLVPPIPRYPEPETIIENNTEEAMTLLRESGFPDGKGLPPLIVKIPEGAESVRLATVMAAAWKDQGIKTEIKTYPFSRYFETLKDGDFTLGTMTWIADFADPLAFLQMWTSSSNLNNGKYADSVYDELIRKSMGQSGEDRYKTLSEAESVLLKTAQVLPIGHNPAINLIDLQFIDGWYQNPLDIHPFKYLRLAPYKPLKGLVRLPSLKQESRAAALRGK